ncbi:hypothetical protein PC116_g17314 [Phytophthora cactorum]|uniref:Uncharacterized protein n=1 Tax=Phytophthora cactorum TaxID=29920 RepID=A0A8T1DZU9_9STRA|nr:hypothetical protein Pcac1_g13889 [Phytophthora cactorum]KAG2898426.1 hypothetical protein PC114_g14290 [Phytophthora cactorum]KAG2946483.1 hypothetical protein PC117_g7607 [Phytophthora cactorum]KAG3017059.1 hypothetical protein PC120_g11250 [Phytophthora cactorum]KAG3027630.1 hypothetical protein PC119_g7298 [Phytophthora cactorum]
MACALFLSCLPIDLQRRSVRFLPAPTSLSARAFFRLKSLQRRAGAKAQERHTLPA